MNRLFALAVFLIFLAQAPVCPAVTTAEMGCGDYPPITLPLPQYPHPRPAPNDHVFVSTPSQQLVTESISMEIPVTRYAGPTDTEEYLVHASALARRQLISKYALLRIPAFDVDDGTLDYETGTVYFNGEPVQALYALNDDVLGSSRSTWRLNTYLIPIEKVKFPGIGVGGPPIPALNTVRIEVHGVGGCVQNPWTIGVEWVSLEIKAMSPIVLVHGNSLFGGWWIREGFTNGLDAEYLGWDNRVSFNPIAAPITRNSFQLSQRLPAIAREWGVNSLHLVAHSKGGLDARDYLVQYVIDNPTAPRILSLTTVSTPHDGSVLADFIRTWNSNVIQWSTGDRFYGMSLFQQAAVRIRPMNEGYIDLTTRFCSRFNDLNVPALPGDTDYGTVAADMDTNATASVDLVSEIWALPRDENWLRRAWDIDPIAAAYFTDEVYQLLRNNKSCSVRYFPPFGSEVPWVYAVHIIAVGGAPNPNDILVPIKSGHGVGGGFAGLVSDTRMHTWQGPQGKNHTNVGGAPSAREIAPWIIATERRIGDLQ